MNSDVPTSKARLSKNITFILENLLGCPLEGTLAAISADAAALEDFPHHTSYQIPLKTTSPHNG